MEDQHVKQSREHLQRDARDQPARLRVRDLAAQVAEPRADEHHNRDHHADESELEQPAPNAFRAEFLGHPIGSSGFRSGCAARAHS